MTSLSASPVFADGDPTRVETGRAFDFTSAINARAYRVFVEIPPVEPPAGGFPVLYLLDGNLHFSPAVLTSRGLAAAGEIRPAVIVGVGYPTEDLLAGLTLRFQDLSMPATEAWLASLGWSAPGMTVDNTGGVDRFLDVIEQEIRPAVAGLVRTNPADQALFGHSLAGHAVLRSLFSNPAGFRTHVASSPSIWWADNAVLGGEGELARHGGDGVRALLCVGALEALPDRAALLHFQSREQAEAALARSRMVDNVRELGGRIAALPGSEVSTVVFEDEGHVSVIPAALCRALRFALGVDVPAPE